MKPPAAIPVFVETMFQARSNRAHFIGSAKEAQDALLDRLCQSITPKRKTEDHSLQRRIIPHHDR